MTACLAPGWGVGPYGMAPWGGSFAGSPGGPIPVTVSFDVYCVGPCGPMSYILTYDEVAEDGDPLQFIIDPATLDLQLGSGGTFPTDDVRVTISKPVPQTFTYEFTVSFISLPKNFTDLPMKHIFIGASDAAGMCVGLFFSLAGIAYTGSVHHTGGLLPAQTLVVDSVVQPLADSELLVSEGEYWTYRIAVDGLTQTVYVFATKTIDLPTFGHQLRYVLPAILSSSAAVNPPDQTLISVRGSVGEPSILSLDSDCLGSTLIIPNLPPIADAGTDQAVRTCSIIQLNGSQSFDPEGSSLTYKWRLIDTPLGSQYVFDGVDGRTFDTLSNFTNKFYSPSLAVLDGVDPIVASLVDGDVLVVAGEPYTIEAKGTDGSGFYVQVPGFLLPDTLLNTSFKLVRQRGISGPTTIKPTFYPDEAGFFKFDLIVSDGQLTSSPAVVIVSVAESTLPRGCIPDVSFMWGYLSDFWDFVEDREHLEVFWGALAQVAASELLTVWQVDYNKSLRDVQRTFQRRWLHYDPLLTEPSPEGTTLRAVPGGCRSVELAVAGTAAYAGTVVTITSPIFKTAFSYTFPGGSMTPVAMAVSLQAALTVYDSRFKVRRFEKNPTPFTINLLRIDAPFPFTITHNSSPAFFQELTNACPSGAGSGVGVKTFLVDRPLTFLGVKEGDLLVIGGAGYKVVRTTSDPGDPWSDQRIVLADDLPVSPATTWELVGKTSSVRLDFHNGLVTAGDQATYSVIDTTTGKEAVFTLPVKASVASTPSSVAVDLTSLNQFLSDEAKYTTVLVGVRRYTYIPIEDLVVDVPYLQEKIVNKDDKTILRRNVDFFIETVRDSNALHFMQAVWDVLPPDRLWAEMTYLDNRPAIEGNFGLPADFTLDDLAQLPSNVDYLSTVRGLWYAYIKGPTLFNLRIGTQILLGLPFAEEAGTITEIRTDFSPSQGRILIQDLSGSGILRSYIYPVDLELEINSLTGAPYVVGDQVSQFAPLVTGAEVVDYIKDPKWFEGYLNQGAFFEVEKFFKFLVRVDSPAFSLSTLLFVKSFIKRIKPTYTFPMFVITRTVGDTEVSTTDLVKYAGTLMINDGACSNGLLGASTMWDEPNPAGGGWTSQYDADANPATVPVYPTSEPVQWGFDRGLLCPEDYIDGSVCIVWAGGVPTYDSIFAWDTEVFQTGSYKFEDAWIMHLDGGSGITLFDSPRTILANATLTDIYVKIVGDAGVTSGNYTAKIITGPGAGPFSTTLVNFTETGATSFSYHAVIAVPIVAGEVLSIVIVPTGGLDTYPFWKTISVELGTSVVWAYDVVLGAGNYCVYKSL